MIFDSQHDLRRIRTVRAVAVVAISIVSSAAIPDNARAQGVASASTALNIKRDQQPMTVEEIAKFVSAFAAAWSARSDAAFAALWHPHGQLVYPFANRIIQGRELPMLNALTKKNAPELTWKLIDWTSRGNVIVIEWESSNRYGERVVTWRGMDKLTLLDGRISEEVVYSDTAPLHALRRGESFQPLILMPEAVD